MGKASLSSRKKSPKRDTAVDHQLPKIPAGWYTTKKTCHSEDEHFNLFNDRMGKRWKGERKEKSEETSWQQ